MRSNIYATAVALSDRDLLARLDALAATERETTAEMLAHLAALDLRASLYLAQGYGSLFDYCTRALRLSEDAACNRTKAVRACQEFPVILDLLFAGKLTLTAVRLLGPHLTLANHEAVLARAAGKSRGDVERVIAEIAPRPDVPTTIRKLATPGAECPVPETADSRSLFTDAARAALPPAQATDDPNGEADQVPPAAVLTVPTVPPPPPVPRPVVHPLSPERYRVQFTIGQETHDRLRRVQSLMRREVPTGDVAAIFDRALEILEQAAKSKLGFPKRPSRPRTHPKTTARPEPDAAVGNYENRIRFETDKPSRHIPDAVKRAVWERDQGRCAFVGTTRQRCAELNYLQFHHRHPYALGGAATIDNISLRCRRHNAFEAEIDFGPRDPSTVSEPRELYR